MSKKALREKPDAFLETTQIDNLSTTRLEELKRELGPHLLSMEQVTPPSGLPTGWTQLDRFLLWHGFPKSSVSLLISESGGASSLWIRSAALVTQAGHWAAWMNDPHTRLTPWSLKHKNVDLSKLLWVSPAQSNKQTLWVMQELMSLCLFELIGCDLGQEQLKEHQILKLKKLSLRYGCAVVLITHAKNVLLSPFFSLILHFQRQHVTIIRALHRHTPHVLEKRDLYADTLPLLASGRRALCG